MSFRDQEEEGNEGAGSLDMRSIYFALLDKLWLIALCVVAAAFVTVGYLKKAPRIYAAQAQLKVEEDPKLFKGIDPLVPDATTGTESLKTLERLLVSRTVLERVISTNSLDTDPRFVPVSDGPRPTMMKMAGMLLGMVKVAWQPGTRLINITVEHSDPKLTAQVANSLVNEFARQTFEQQSLAYTVNNEFLNVEEKRLRAKINDTEKALQQYREKKLEGDLDIVQQKLKALSGQVTDATAELIKKRAEFSIIETAGTNVSLLLNMPTIASDGNVGPALTKLKQAEADFSALKLRYKWKHPKYGRAESELHELKASLSNATLSVVATIRNGYESARATQEALQKALKAQEDKAMELSYKSIEYKAMQRDLQSDQTLYELVIKRRKEAEMVREVGNNNIQFVQQAFVPDKPIRPDKFKILATGLMIGLLAGAGIALGLFVIDSSLRSTEQAEEFLKTPLLSSIPQVREVESGKKNLLMAEDNECVESESFRTLRTTLAMLGPEAERRSFLFTSAVPEEGKTFCASNFAVSLAQQGLRTVLVEGDLRCPAIAGVLLPKAKRAPGVTDYLSKQKLFGDIVQPSGVENLWFIAAGTQAPNPSELLSRNELENMIQEALQKFDRVVIDSAPVNPVSDSLLMVNRVQTVCLVVRANKTPKKVAQRAVQMLVKARAPLAGFILNGVARNRSEYYNYDYSYYPKYAPREASKV